MDLNKTTLGPWSFRVFVSGRLSKRDFKPSAGRHAVVVPKKLKDARRKERNARKREARASTRRDKENVPPSGAGALSRSPPQARDTLAIPPAPKLGRPPKMYSMARLNSFYKPIDVRAHRHMKQQFLAGAITLAKPYPFDLEASEVAALDAVLNANGKRAVVEEEAAAGGALVSEDQQTVTQRRSKRLKK